MKKLVSILMAVLMMAALLPASLAFATDGEAEESTTPQVRPGGTIVIPAADDYPKYNVEPNGGQDNKGKATAATAYKGDLWIDLSKEELVIKEGFDFTVAAYSIDGGGKWVSGGINAAAFAKALDKGMTLWVADKFDSKNKIPTEYVAPKAAAGEEKEVIEVLAARIVKFPEIGARPKAEKLTVNFGVCSSNVWDTYNRWTLTAKGETDNKALAITEDHQTHKYQIALTSDGKKPGTEGWGYFPQDGGINLTPTGKKIMYLVRTAPVVGKENIAASKAYKVTPKAMGKKTSVKADYKKEIIVMKVNQVLVTDGAYKKLNTKWDYFAEDENKDKVVEIEEGSTEALRTIEDGKIYVCKDKKASAIIGGYLDEGHKLLYAFTRGASNKVGTTFQPITLAERAPLEFKSLASSINKKNRKLTIPKTMEVFNVDKEKWGSLPKYDSSVEMPIRVKSAAKANPKGTDSGKAASKQALLSVYYGPYLADAKKQTMKDGTLDAQIVTNILELVRARAGIGLSNASFKYDKDATTKAEDITKLVADITEKVEKAKGKNPTVVKFVSNDDFDKIDVSFVASTAKDENDQDVVVYAYDEASRVMTIEGKVIVKKTTGSTAAADICETEALTYTYNVTDKKLDEVEATIEAIGTELEVAIDKADPATEGVANDVKTAILAELKKIDDKITDSTKKRFTNVMAQTGAAITVTPVAGDDSQNPHTKGDGKYTVNVKLLYKTAEYAEREVEVDVEFVKDSVQLGKNLTALKTQILGTNTDGGTDGVWFNAQKAMTDYKAAGGKDTDTVYKALTNAIAAESKKYETVALIKALADPTQAMIDALERWVGKGKVPAGTDPVTAEVPGTGVIGATENLVAVTPAKDLETAKANAKIALDKWNNPTTGAGVRYKAEYLRVNPGKVNDTFEQLTDIQPYTNTKDKAKNTVAQPALDTEMTTAEIDAFTTANTSALKTWISELNAKLEALETAIKTLQGQNPPAPQS